MKPLFEWTRKLLLRPKAFLHRRNFDRDLEEEMAFHLAMRQEKHVENSDSARRQFGNVTRIKEACREMRTFASLESFLQDLRFGFRGLRKAPALTAIAVVTFALGIGASTWVFNLTRQWVLQAATFPHGDRLMVLWETDRKNGCCIGASAPDFLDWRAQAHEFQSLSAWTTQQFNVTGVEVPQRVLGGRVSADFFRTFNVTPALGRDFLPEEELLGREHVAVISMGMWHDRYNSATSVLGSTIVLDNQPYTIVGVAPQEFHFTLMGRANLWVPLAFSDKERSDRKTGWLNVVGRLKSGLSEAAAQQSLTEIARLLEKQWPESNANSGILLNSLSHEIGKHTGGQGIYMGFIVGICILLISCSNIAGIYLARSIARRKEITMRLALGAKRKRIARQLLSEGLLLLPLSVLLGLALAYAGGKWITWSIPYDNRGYLPNYGEVYMDYTTLLYASAISLFSVMVFSMAPILEGWKLDLTGALKQNSASSAFSETRFRKSLVVVEVVLALAVLVPAGLTSRSLANRLKQDLGFNPDHVLTAKLGLPLVKYKTPEQWQEFYAQLSAKLDSQPQFQSAGLGRSIPFGHEAWGDEFDIDGQPAPQGQAPSSLLNPVTTGYIRSLGLTLVRGRMIMASDGATSAPVVVVNQTFVNRYFSQGEGPLGHRVRFGRDSKVWRTIVGVVRDIKQSDLGEPPRNQAYLPFAQSPSRTAAVVVRSDAAPESLVNSLRQAVWSVDKDQPISEIEPLFQRISDDEAPFRVFAQFSGLFAGTALFLAAMGIYGVMAYLVESRRREIGIRMACGATPRGVLWLVLQGSLRLVVIGVGLGLVFAWGLSRLLANLLFGITPNDLGTYCTAVLVLATAIMVACIVPLRRAARVDPMIVLRYE